MLHFTHSNSETMKKLFQSLSALALAASTWSATAADQINKPGQKAPNFVIKMASDARTTLNDLREHRNVVMVMLRGWPGYQCPLCSRQVGSFISKSKEFTQRNAHLVLIYPGPGAKLDEHAKEFLKRIRGEWPNGFTFITDPDYKITNLYGLRWDARRETAYPATYVIDQKGVVQFAKVSRSHGGRTNPQEALEALDKLGK